VSDGVAAMRANAVSVKMSRISCAALNSSAAIPISIL